MSFSEKSIEDLIYSNLSNIVDRMALSDKGFNEALNYTHFERQLDLGNYGRLDLIGFNYLPFEAGNDIKGFGKTIQVGVFEIKKGQINIETYIQASRYATGIRHYFSLKKIRADVCIHLLGTSARMNELYHLVQPGYLTVHTLSLDLSTGIKFTGYTDHRCLNEPNFRKNTSAEKNVFKLIKERIADKVKYLHIEKDERGSNVI